jgi:23S rRNA pseudouridine1911/1915/1917 synthase
MAIRTFVTDRGDAGRRIDQVVQRHLGGLPGATRTRVQHWIADGLVTINGRTVRRPAGRVAGGDTISVLTPHTEPARQPMLPSSTALEVLFEDESLLAINKPAGVVVHPTHAHRTGTLMNDLLGHAQQWPSGLRPSIVGRLDRLTSGVVLVAKGAAIHAALQRAMTAAACEKHYLAIVYGRVNPSAGSIDLRLRRDSLDRRKVIASKHAGVASLTHFARLAGVAARPVGLALLQCRLVTGRTHQIRVHLAARGWPIVGDPVYGKPHWSRIADPRLAAALQTFPRQALHASHLALIHPATQGRLEIEAPVPEDMEALLDLSRLVPRERSEQCQAQSRGLLAASVMGDSSFTASGDDVHGTGTAIRCRASSGRSEI